MEEDAGNGQKMDKGGSGEKCLGCLEGFSKNEDHYRCRGEEVDSWIHLGLRFCRCRWKEKC